MQHKILEYKHAFKYINVAVKETFQRIKKAILKGQAAQLCSSNEKDNFVCCTQK